MSRAHSVVVIGAGPAGLAVGACLRRRDIPFVVLEREQRIAPAWRRHYERLHLHTAKQLSALPYVRWPDTVPTYPSRAQVVDYLERYADHFRLAPRLGAPVRRAAREGQRWVVRTDDDGELEAEALVVATGYNRVPREPLLEGRDHFGGRVLHSSGYDTGARWKGRRALVVGIGNSGAEIALDLWEHGAEVAIAVRGPVHVVPRDAFGVPAQVTSVLVTSKLPTKLADRLVLRICDRIYGDLSPWGLVRPSIGPVSQVRERGRVPLIDVGTVELIRQGRIQVVPAGVRGLTPDGVVFDDGREQRFDLVVLATGYRPGIGSFLESAEKYLNERGYPRWHGREPPDRPGLWFVGFRNPPTGQLHDIALEAPRVAAEIEERLS